MVLKPASKSLPVYDASPEFWRSMILQIPTVFGRIVYLSSLGNPKTRQYEHHGLYRVCGVDAHRVIAASHEAVFVEWLQLDLAAQIEDLSLYFGSLGKDLPELVETFVNSEPHRAYVPAGAKTADCATFSADMTSLLAIMKGQLLRGTEGQLALGREFMKAYRETFKTLAE